MALGIDARSLMRRYGSAAFRYILIGLTYVVVASVVTLAFMRRWGLRGDDKEYGFEALLDHTGHRPFVYRILSFDIVNWLSQAVPASVAERIIAQGREREAPQLLQLTSTRPLQEYVAYVYAFVVLVLLLLALRWLLAKFPKLSPSLTDFAPAVAVLGLPLTFRQGGYLYDFPELLFATLALGAALSAKWPGYYVVLMLAVLNKETAILFSLYVAGILCADAASHAGPAPRRLTTIARKLNWKRAALHVLLHAVLALPLYVWLRLRFAGQPGDVMQLNLLPNLEYFLSKEAYLGVHSIYTPLLPVPLPTNLVILLLIGLGVYLGWREVNPTIRWVFGWIVLVNVPLYLVSGNTDEVRAMYLIFPSLLVILSHSVAWVYSGQTRQEVPQSPGS